MTRVDRRAKLACLAAGCAIGLGSASLGCTGDDTDLSAALFDAAMPPDDAGALDATRVVDSGPPSTMDGSGDADAHVSDGGMADDGSDAADASSSDAALPRLSCTTWRFASPLVLQDLSADAAATAGSFDGELWIGEPSSGRPRVIVRPVQQKPGGAFRIYDIDTGSSAVSTLDGPSDAGTYVSARHAASVNGVPATQILVEEQTSTIAAYVVPDALTTAGPLPAPSPVCPSGSGVAALAFDNGDTFAAVTYEHLFAPPEIDYALGVALAVPGAAAELVPIEESAHSDDFQNVALAHAGSSVFLFASNGAATLGESAWVVPDTGEMMTDASTLLSARAFDTAPGALMVDVAPGVTSGTTNFAYLTEAATGGGLVVRAGQVGDAKLPTIAATDLTIQRTYDDLTVAPIYRGRAEWSGDDLMIVGAGLAEADGGLPTGANLVWINATSGVRAEQSGAAAILQSEGSSIRTIVASPAETAPASATWDVAWIEARGSGEVLLFNELQCE